MKKDARKILEESRDIGWVMEPYAKSLLTIFGLQTTEYFWAKSESDALKGARKIGYPVVAKVVSPSIMHKTEAGGVVLGIKSDDQMKEAYNNLSRLENFEGILIDAMVSGTELIIGSKNESQFGPVVLIGIGGTSVEIYRDVAIRIAPTTLKNAKRALMSLKGRELLTGFRGSEPVNIERLSGLIVDFSKMVYELRDEVSSIDLNPVFANNTGAFIADARFVLA